MSASLVGSEMCIRDSSFATRGPRKLLGLTICRCSTQSGTHTSIASATMARRSNATTLLAALPCRMSSGNCAMSRELFSRPTMGFLASGSWKGGRAGR
eukprot:2944901-Alexandrium_andersonii.AAC.1